MVGVFTVFTLHRKAYLSSTFRQYPEIPSQWTTTQQLRGTNVSSSEGRTITTSGWYSIRFRLRFKLPSHARHNAELLCSVIEHKLWISTASYINFPYSIISRQPSRQMAICRYILGNTSVCHCVKPLASHQPLQFPNSATFRTTQRRGCDRRGPFPFLLNGSCGDYILITCIHTEVPEMRVNMVAWPIIR